MYILGISAFYHDSAACLVHEGEIIAAAQEERFTRKKHDSSFPHHAVRFCLAQAGIKITDVKYLVFYDKPLIKFERLLETYVGFSPKGIQSFLAAMPVWLKEKLFLRKLLQKEVLTCMEGVDQTQLPELLFGEHHESHAASAFFASPYQKSGVLCMDGVGEWATTSAWLGEGNTLTPLWEIPFPHSLGLLYSAFTYYTGFKVNSGEYKVMGLAPYGEPKYVKAIYEHLLDLKPDGTFRMNMEYFNYCTGLTMTSRKFDEVFGGPPRQPESKLSQREMDLARSIQEVTEEVMLRLSRTIHRETGVDYLCMAGGVALNCVGNGRVLREGPFKGIWIQPAAGDAGGALGAALSAWHLYENKPRTANNVKDQMKGSYLGPAFSNDEVELRLKQLGAAYVRLGEKDLFTQVAEELAAGKVVGWFQGRMEFGPRSLGGRSILGDARNTKMQSVMNLKIKYRESFRPFAPSVLRERVNSYFQMDCDSPYMLLVAPVQEKRRLPFNSGEKGLWGIELLNVLRSDIPAVTHIDYSARIQTVHEDTNPRYYYLLKAFEERTGYATLVNTSFNVRGEPIVCTPEDAFRCFMRTEMDILVLENCVLKKEDQKPLERDTDWKQEFALD
ncbi:MAG: carbamoyltransferase [Nitrospira sp.]|nr:carbamoyltransferase [Nitrospira sp.]